MGLKKRVSAKDITLQAGEFDIVYPRIDNIFTEPKSTRTHSSDRWVHGIFGSGSQYQTFWGTTVDFGPHNAQTFTFDNDAGDIFDIRFIINNAEDKTLSGIWMFDPDEAFTAEYGYRPKMKRAPEMDSVGDYDVQKCYVAAGGDSSGKVFQLKVDDPTAAIGTVEIEFLPQYASVDNFGFGYSAQTFVVEAKLTQAITLTYDSASGTWRGGVGTYTLDNTDNILSHANKNIYITNDSGGNNGVFQYMGNIYGGLPTFGEVGIKTGDAFFVCKSDSTRYVRDGTLGGTFTAV